MDYVFNLGEAASVNSAGQTLAAAGINLKHTKANDRRKYIKFRYGDWFAEQNLKLGRDYYLEFGPRDWYGPWNANPQVSISFKDSKKAMLFKLTWLGTV